MFLEYLYIPYNMARAGLFIQLKEEIQLGIWGPKRKSYVKITVKQLLTGSTSIPETKPPECLYEPRGAPLAVH